MRCGQARRLLSEVAGGELGGERARAVQLHAADCPDCASTLAEMTKAVELCRRVGGESVPDGFGLALRRQLVEAGAPRASVLERIRAVARARPLATGIAAAALSAVVATAATARVLGRRHDATAQPALVAHRVPVARVALVKVDFVSEADIEDVRFEVLLPDGLRFVSKGRELAERSFQWQGRLVRGSNFVPIAIRGAHPGRYRVIAHAIAPDVDVSEEVVIEVTS